MNRITVDFPDNKDVVRKITFNCPLRLEGQDEFITTEEVQKRLKTNLQLISLAAIFNSKKTIEVENWNKKDFRAFKYACKCFNNIIASLNYDSMDGDIMIVEETCKQLLGDDVCFW